MSTNIPFTALGPLAALEDLQAAINQGGGGGGSGASISVTLSNAQILSIAAGGIVQAVPAPGAGKALMVTSCYYEFTYDGTNVFTVGSNTFLDFQYGTNGATAEANILATCGGFMDVALNEVLTVIVGAATNQRALIENQPLNFFLVPGGSLADGGESGLKVTIGYMILNLA